ncbi:MAG TPA: hypothetical protein VEM14_08415, partial [Gemmatimonadaceae bacterium]|nr:hypothetical protein [Gemmatimonadaceae bacterium]
MSTRAELERFCEWRARVARVSRVCATVAFAAVTATSCVNLHASADGSASRRMPPVVVTRPGEDVPLDKRPMLPADS